ncbi:unnamed protein product, partial [Closterium sp. NIES-53]
MYLLLTIAVHSLGAPPSPSFTSFHKPKVFVYNGLIYAAQALFYMAAFLTTGFPPLAPRPLQTPTRFWLLPSPSAPHNQQVFVYDGLIYAAQAFSYMAAFLTIGFFALFLPCIALAHFYFKTLVAAWGAKGVLNAVRFFVAGYKIHFDFLCPTRKFPPTTNHLTAPKSSASPAAAPGTVLHSAAPPALSSWVNSPQVASSSSSSSSSSVSGLKWTAPGELQSVAEEEESAAAARGAEDVLLRPCSDRGPLPPFPVLKTKREELD